jgi:hypothetical protein
MIDQGLLKICVPFAHVRMISFAHARNIWKMYTAVENTILEWILHRKMERQLKIYRLCCYSVQRMISCYLVSFLELGIYISRSRYLGIFSDIEISISNGTISRFWG